MDAKKKRSRSKKKLKLVEDVSLKQQYEDIKGEPFESKDYQKFIKSKDCDIHRF